jgi:hypothetical protein
MVSYDRGVVNQTLKNQTAGNVRIRCRLEKIDKTGRHTADRRHKTRSS